MTVASLAVIAPADHQAFSLVQSRRLGQVLDDLDELVAAVAVVAGERDQLGGFGDDRAARRRAGDVGIDCPGTANSIACDRVGLAISLRHPAVALTATIAGRPLTLHAARVNNPLSAAPGQRKAFTGYLQPAGIVNHLHVRPVERDHWYGNGRSWPSPKVTLRISYPHGQVVTTQLHIDLNTGWG